MNANMRGMRAPARRLVAMSSAPSLVATGCTVLAGIGVGTLVAQADAALSPSAYRVSALCSAPDPGYAGCLGLRLVARQPPERPAAQTRTSSGQAASQQAASQQAASGQAGDPAVEEFDEPLKGSLSPQKLLGAYGLGGVPAPAAQQTLAVVDAYDDPTAEHDLGVFDERYGLPACTAANGCFTKVKVGSPKVNAGWAQEIATDVEVAHGTCPSCKILLVEARSNANGALEEGEREAERRGAQEISNSWGGPEQGVSVVAEQASPFDHPDTVIAAATGDNGYLNWDAEEGSEIGYVDYPASSPHVIAVGGTRLGLTAQGAWAGESVWNGYGSSGGGCSTVFTAPPWQQGVAGWSSVGCHSGRAVADISADADPYTGVAIYDSTTITENGVEYRGWFTIGGTSVASPFIAGAFALAGGAQGGGDGEAVAYPAQTLYENLASHPEGLHDVTSGSNGPCSNGFDEETGLAECTLAEEDASCQAQSICRAGPGYDGPSGVGTPNGIAAFELQEIRSEDSLESAAVGSGGGASGQGAAGTGAPGAGAGHGGAQGIPKIPPVVSKLALTRAAAIALRRVRPRVSEVSFAFTLSSSARVKVTLAKQVLVGRRKRWQTLPDSVTVAATKGRNGGHLKAHGALAQGRYELTLTPVGGHKRSLVFRIP
jgi:hypothetical protein